MEVPKRIHIIGSTGSGKTYLAERISKKNRLSLYELDTVMWSSSKEFSGKNPPEVRDKLLNQIISQERWIVEGVYYKWLASSFERAEIIIFLDTDLFKRDIRIVLRFMKQRLGIERSIYKQTFRGLLKMIAWNHKFDRINKKKIVEFLEPYKSKVMFMKDIRDIEKLFENGSDIT